jgi:gamma-glutamyltranspeptidase / glutathione hydrolase
MKTRALCWVRGFLHLCFCLWLVVGFAVLSHAVGGDRGMVVTGHPLATKAGLDVLKRGGNAVDAVVAAGLVLGVVDGHNSGIGGGCVMLVRRANGEIVAIDGREMAPILAGPDMFIRNGRADPALSRLGALSIATPGALMAYNYAALNFGRLPIREHLVEAARLAENGFAIDAAYAERLAASARELSLFSESRAIFLRPNGAPLRAGEVLRQADLAATYRAIAGKGVAYFYAGPFAEATAQWMVKNGGILSAADFVAYAVIPREPIRTTYRGRVIVGFPPPSSGGTAVAEILNILENFDLKEVGNNSAELIHVVTEAMKLAFADRAFWLGDPDYMEVPRGLVSKQYAAQLALRINRDRVTPVLRHGNPARGSANPAGTHTTHFCAADADGNWAACTSTINTSFGSKVVIPGTGVLMNNQMDDFAAKPGEPNFFGLTGSAANAIMPGKRPLTSMSPTFVFENNLPIMAVGAAGGPTIINQVVLAIINSTDFGMDLEGALAQPRFHHQWRPDELRIEESVENAIVQALEKRGHRIARVPAIGAANAIGVSKDGKGFVGVAEPRGAGQAAGW